MPGRFFDTNVLLYVASGDSAKSDQAERLIGVGGIISVQALNEIANVARRKMRLSWAGTHAFLGMIRDLLPVRSITVAIHEAGLALAERHGLSIYDAMPPRRSMPGATRFGRKTCSTGYSWTDVCGSSIRFGEAWRLNAPAHRSLA